MSRSQASVGEISRTVSALDIPNLVRETAGTIYRRAVEDDLLPDQSIEGMATAALYAAARQYRTSRQLAEFAEVSRVAEIRIQRAYRYVSRELRLEITSADPLEHVPSSRQHSI